MIAQVRRLVNDTEARTWADAVIGAYLETGTAVLSAELAAHPTGRRALRVQGDPIDIEADVAALALPADCLKLETVSLRTAPGFDWVTMVRRPPPQVAGTRSGMGYLFGALCPSTVVGTLCWWDGDTPDEIAVWPTPTEVEASAGWQMRLTYARALAMPTADAGTLENPFLEDEEEEEGEEGEEEGGEEEETRWVPELAPQAIEYYAAAMLGGEELEDGKPLGVFGRLYRSTFDLIAVSGAPTHRPAPWIKVMRR